MLTSIESLCEDVVCINNSLLEFTPFSGCRCHAFLQRHGLCLSSFPRVETRFNTHYQNAYANAFLELLHLSSTLWRVRVERKALSLRSCIAQFDPWSRYHVGHTPLHRSVGDIKAFQNNFTFIIPTETCFWLKRVSDCTFLTAFQKGVSNPLIKTALRLSSAKITLKVVGKPTPETWW